MCFTIQHAILFSKLENPKSFGHCHRNRISLNTALFAAPGGTHFFNNCTHIAKEGQIRTSFLVSEDPGSL